VPEIKSRLFTSFTAEIKKDGGICTYCSGDKMVKNEMGGACSASGGEERRIQGIDGET
jgi:Fe-S cluster biogenesis protein NfuA